MSNVEHLFENALVALENDYYFGEWKRIEKDRHNTDGVSEEVIEAIWELAIYTKYTYVPSLNAIPIEWIKKFIDNDILSETVKILLNAWEWEKENEISVMPVSDNSTIPLDYLGGRKWKK